MTRRPDLSIVIVNWNTRKILLECLASIEEDASKPETEVIVVDNGSEDDSVAAVRERFPGVTVIENGENLGFARANNIGITRSKGRFVCLSNSDILVGKGCLAKMIAYLESHPEVGLVGPKILYPDLSLQNSCRRFPNLWTRFLLALGADNAFRGSRWLYGEHMAWFDHDRTVDTDNVMGCFMLVRRQAIEEVGLLDERFFIYSEEVDWCKRMWKAGWRVAFFHEAEVVHHHAASSSIDRSRFALEQQHSLVQYWMKHHGPIRTAFLIAILIVHSGARILLIFPIYLFSARKRRDTGNTLKVHRLRIESLLHPRCMVPFRR